MLDPNKRNKSRQSAIDYYHRNAKVNPVTKVRAQLRKRLRKYVDSRGLGIQKLTGCSGRQLRDHLEGMFTEEMTWENYGIYWVVDHKQPLSSFDLTKKSHQLMASHYTNLQPLTREMNASKSDNVVPHQPDLPMPTFALSQV